MKVDIRQAKILEIIRENKQVQVEYLAEILEISRETIRRDLIVLAKKGQVLKIHGGASLPNIFGEGSFQQRLSDNVSAKIQIAKTAALKVKPGETVFIDTGSTTLYFAEKLAKISGLTIVTNSTEIAKTISTGQNNNRCFLLGGEYSADNSQTFGTMVGTQISSFRAHHAILTIGALDERTGVMNFNIEEAQVARAMIAQSQSVTILVDGSKFNKIASFEVCPLAKINQIICDVRPPEKLYKAIKAAGVNIILAQD
ncbi:MAG: DeoR family transcriptional regulator [Alphaproteobacteria bacterium]|nr:MAG: DeoR family transcriptional regulator [Alphaproteobacteria bacterium]